MAKLPQKNLKDGLDVASVGIEMALAIVVGYFVGQWFDTQFSMAPWGSVIWLFGGFGAAVKALLRVTRTAKRVTGSARVEGASVDAALVASQWAADHRRPRAEGWSR